MTNTLAMSLGPVWAKLEKDGSACLIRQVVLEKGRLAAWLKRHPEEMETARIILEEWLPQEKIHAFITAWVLGLPVAIKASDATLPC